MDNNKPPSPATLGTEGRKLWRSIVGAYDLRQDELRILEDACTATDMLAQSMIEWEKNGKPFTAKGSMGQLIEHPLIGSIDKQRKSRQTCFRLLKLPDESAASDASNQQRAAANARWAKQTGS